MSEVRTLESGRDAASQSDGGFDPARRRTARVKSNFTATISGTDAAGGDFEIEAVSTFVSPGGASFSLGEDEGVAGRFHVGQRVSVETSLGTLEAEVNGVWFEPKDSPEGEPRRPHVGLRLLDGQTWTTADVV
jgi:hypothetical protein